jgi:hypothetical protein
MSLYLDGVPDLRALSGGRELDEIPWHFQVVKADEHLNVDQARAWIWKNLEGRFSVVADSHFNKWQLKIGFEDPMEASAFLISQPLIVERSDPWA